MRISKLLFLTGTLIAFGQAGTIGQAGISDNAEGSGSVEIEFNGGEIEVDFNARAQDTADNNADNTAGGYGELSGRSVIEENPKCAVCASLEAIV